MSAEHERDFNCVPPWAELGGTCHLTGKGTSFYSWLEVSPSATTQEIARAYRKKSIQLQYVAHHLALDPFDRP